MSIDPSGKYYILPGVKHGRKGDGSLMLISPYSGFAVELSKVSKCADLIMQLDGKKSMKTLLREAGFPPSIIRHDDFRKDFECLLEKKIVAKGRYRGLLTTAEVHYYANNILYLGRVFADDGVVLQALLKKKKICVVGAGGAAAMMLVSLGGMGIGRISLIDHDILEASNLPRQVFFKYADIGKKKAVLLKKYLEDHNPFIEVEAHEVFLDSQNKKNKAVIAKIFKGSDLVIVAADSPSHFAVVNYVQEICFEESIPFIGSACSDGLVTPLVIPYQTPCFQCFLTQFFPDSGIERGDAAERLNAAWMSVPYYHLAELNTYVAREILKFLLFSKSDLIGNCILPFTSKLMVMRSSECACMEKKSQRDGKN